MKRLRPIIVSPTKRDMLRPGCWNLRSKPPRSRCLMFQAASRRRRVSDGPPGARDGAARATPANAHSVLRRSILRLFIVVSWSWWCKLEGLLDKGLVPDPIVLPNFAPKDLSERRQWQAVSELDPLGHFERRQTGLAVLEQLGFARGMV